MKDLSRETGLFSCDRARREMYFASAFGSSVPGKDQSASKALRTDGRSTLVSSLLGTVDDGSLLSSSLSSPWRDRTASLFRSAGGLSNVSGARSSSAASGELLFSVFWKLRLSVLAEENTSPKVRINSEYEASALHLSMMSRSLSSVRYGSCFPGEGRSECSVSNLRVCAMSIIFFRL